MSRKRRDRLTIMAEILNAASKGTVKTRIMCRADLSFAQLEEYIPFLREVKLLRVNRENGRTIYERTQKGAKYLETFLEIKGLLKKTGRSNPIHTPPYWTKLEE